MKSFIIEIQEWLNHRLRQLIWKRWKEMKTRYKMLRKYGINHDEAGPVPMSPDYPVYANLFYIFIQG